MDELVKQRERENLTRIAVVVFQFVAGSLYAIYMACECGIFVCDKNVTTSST